MKKIFKAGLCVLTGIIIGSATVVGANQAVQAIQNSEIKVTLNGIEQLFKDEKTGEVQYPLTYHDRTYLPLRNIAQLTGLNVEYDSKTKTAKLNEEFLSYIEAYESIINSHITMYGKDYVKYELVYFNDDDVPDLLYGLPGYWSAIAIYKDGELHFPLGEEGIGYGAGGRSGFQMFEKNGTIIDHDSDYAGGVIGISYMKLNDNYSLDMMYSRQLGAFEGIELNTVSEEDKEYYKEMLEDVEQYGGFFDFSGNKISESEFKKLLNEEFPMTGKSISCEPTQKASEVLEKLFEKYDNGVRNQKIEEYIKTAYNGQKEITVNGKKESVYDYVYDFNNDKINDLIRVEGDNDLTVFCLNDDGVNFAAKLRKDCETEGVIKAIYIARDKNNSPMSLYNQVYVRIDEEDEVVKSEGYYELNMDYRNDLYFYNFYLKEDYLDKDTKKVVGTKYYKKSYGETGVAEMSEEDYKWQINRITKSDDNKIVTIINNRLGV